MQGGLIGSLESLGPIAASLLVLAALFLLWRRQNSVWLIVAIVAEALGLAFRGVLAVAPDFVRTTPLMFTLWMLAGIVFAIGLFGYALEVTQRH
jgi:hypothetical protein